VQDFARLSVGGRVEVVRLIGGEKPQHAACNLGIEPQREQGRDDGVAAERCAEPRDTGIWVGSMVGFRDQHVEIGHGPADDLVEQGVCAFDSRGAPAGPTQLTHRVLHVRQQDASLPAIENWAARRLNDDGLSPFGRHGEAKARRAHIEPRGRRVEADERLPHEPVEAAVA
jgi:hypothetical protein